MTEEQMKAMLELHLAKIQTGLQTHAEQMGGAVRDMALAMRESAELAAQTALRAEEGPTKRLRQNLAAQFHSIILKAALEDKSSGQTFSPKAIAETAVRHADALLVALEEKS